MDHSKKLIFSFSVIMLFLLAFPIGAADYYWEDPETITSSDSRFPKVVQNSKQSVIFWEEIDKSTESIWISLKYFDSDGNWKEKSRFAGPYKYSGEVPDIFSAAQTDSGKICAAVQTTNGEIETYSSSDLFETFQKSVLTGANKSFVAPRIFSSSQDGFILFVSYAKGKNNLREVPDADSELDMNLQFYLASCTSQDGKNWTNFTDVSLPENYKNSFSPTVSSLSGTDFLVFQSQYMEGGRLSYQLLMSTSKNGGKNWSECTLVSGNRSVSSNKEFTDFQNQRPQVYTFGGKVYLAWERRLRKSEIDEIWFEEINSEGIVPGSSECISDKGVSKRPVLFKNKENLCIVWFDTRSGSEQIYFAERKGSLWTEEKISYGTKSHLFPFPFFLGDGKLSFVWQENSGTTRQTPYIAFLSPDNHVNPPEIRPLNIKKEVHSLTKHPKFRIVLPHDSSDVAGYVYSWSNDKEILPEKVEKNIKLPRENTLSLTSGIEGNWYLKVSAYDYAGNWSEPAVISYYYDETPPSKVIFEPYSTDVAGFSESNSVYFSWKPSPENDDVQGYTYSFKRLTGIDQAFVSTPKHPSLKSEEEQKAYIEDLKERYSKYLGQEQKLKAGLQLYRPELSFRNQPNGIYLLTVSAIDTVGLEGKQESVLVFLNKYIPRTRISSVESHENNLGEIILSVNGSDFLIDGTVKRIIVDRDGKAPYDYEISDGFKVSQNKISGIKLDADVEEGSYYVGLVHSDRGFVMSGKKVLNIDSSGTVKIETYYQVKNDFEFTSKKYKYHLEVGLLIEYIIFALSAFFLFYFGLSIRKNISESLQIRKMLYEVTQGAVMTVQKTEERKGSLKNEIIGFTISLILLAVLGIAIPFTGYKISDTERQLSSSLKQKVDVILSSLSSGARAYLPSNNILELSMLPDQAVSLSEAEYVTITGFAYEDESVKARNSSLLNVWSSSDPEILTKIDTSELNLGSSLLVSKYADEMQKITQELNLKAQNELSETVKKIRELNQEGIALSLKTDEASLSRLEEISRESQEITIKFNSALEELSKDGSGSFPEFDSNRLNRSNTSYLFYRPIMFRSGSSDDLVRGVVLIKINTVSLIQEVDKAVRVVIIIITVVAGIVLVLGSIGAIIVARHLANPLKKLEKFVQKIADEKHKENLAGKNKNITIVQNNEIGRLGDAMNRLKEELASNAIEEKLTNDGKAVQKAFLPLTKNENGIGQKTTATYSDQNIQAFGYYEGASAVSGDYFDYKKLDDRWYVFIKSDASGHGTPAGLIMTVVATLFNKYFENWSQKTGGTDISKLVYQINDFLESLGLKGKFATIILVLFDSKTGKMIMCNAGDNLVHVYAPQEAKLKTISLKETPAAGPFPGFMVDMKGGFIMENSVLNHDDILFLYTDGIEESTRIVRNSNYEPIREEINGKIEEKKELLEADRVKQIIEAVFAKTKFVLKKDQNPDLTEELVFDFSTCEGTINDAIIALVSVEKVFRFYKPQYVTAVDTVLVDQKIDAFLKEHFNLYSKYCVLDEKSSEEYKGQNYVVYNYLLEDDQADDLTILAIKRQ